LGATRATLVGVALAKTFTLQVAKSANVTNQSGMTATENIAVNSGGFVLDTLTGDRKSQNAPRATAASASGHPLTVASAKQLSKAPGIKGKLGVWHRNGFFQVRSHPLYRYAPDTQRHANGNLVEASRRGRQVAVRTLDNSKVPGSRTGCARSRRPLLWWLP
jgi:hypothetical protein